MTQNNSEPSNHDSATLARRNFLSLAGASIAAAFFAGCGSSKTPHLVDDLPYAPLSPFNPQHTPLLPAPPSPAPVAGVIPRSAWAKAGPDLKRVDPMHGVSLITFHHSGDPKPFTINSYAETAAHLEGVREYHRSRNFQDIGYHFAIDRAGRVWQLRPLAYQGQHVRYNNEHNIGVCVLGNFDLQTPTAAQKEKIRSFGFLLRKQYSLPIAKIKTHQEIVSTECPGDSMQPYMVLIRKQNLI